MDIDIKISVFCQSVVQVSFNLNDLKFLKDVISMGNFVVSDVGLYDRSDVGFNSWLSDCLL